jgi:hypothetical protein
MGRKDIFGFWDFRHCLSFNPYHDGRLIFLSSHNTPKPLSYTHILHDNCHIISTTTSKVIFERGIGSGIESRWSTRFTVVLARRYLYSAGLVPFIRCIAWRGSASSGVFVCVFSCALSQRAQVFFYFLLRSWASRGFTHYTTYMQAHDTSHDWYAGYVMGMVWVWSEARGVVSIV